MERDAWNPKVGTTSWRKRPELESGWCLTRDSYSIAVSLAFLLSLEFYILKLVSLDLRCFKERTAHTRHSELLFLRKESIKGRRNCNLLSSFTSDNHSVRIILSYPLRLSLRIALQNYNIFATFSQFPLNKIIVSLTAYFLLYPQYSPRLISLSLPQKILVS